MSSRAQRGGCPPTTNPSAVGNATNIYRGDYVDQYDKQDWWRQLFDTHRSMLREIFSRVIFALLWTGAVFYVHIRWTPLDVPNVTHIIVGGFLSLLLVFRTNSSYDRFWEGRKMWGGINNESRNLARLCDVHLAAEPALRKSTLLWAIELPWSIMHALRHTEWTSTTLPADQVEAVSRSAQVPLAVCRKITALLKTARDKGVISDWVMVSIDANLQQIVDYLGACERIHKTPLPFAYVVHLRRALVLYIYALPFSLLSSFGWETFPAMFLISFVLFGIEEIGVELEDPFGKNPNHLSLELYCHGIQKVLSDVLENGEASMAGAPPPR